MSAVSVRGPEETAGRLLSAARVAYLPIIVAFFLTRVAGTPAAFASAQLLFLLPVAGASAATLWAYHVGPHGAERRAWGFLALVGALLFVGEFYFSYYQLAVSPAGPPSPSLYDLTNLLAAAAYVAAMWVAAGLDRIPLAAAGRLAADAVAVFAVGYAFVYHLWISRLYPNAGWESCAFWAAYSVMGLAVLGAGLWVTRGNPKAFTGARGLVAGAALVFSAGMIAAPVWQNSSGPPSTSLVEDAITGVVFLSGYYLLLLGGLSRVAGKDEPWRAFAPPVRETESTLVSTALAAFVLLAVGLIGRWGYLAQGGDAESLLYVVTGTVATLAVVVRTSFLAVEAGRLQVTSETDPVTGALNHRAYQERGSAAMSLAARRGEPVVLAMLDLDAFARVNALLGHTEGDRVLALVASALKGIAGEPGSVYRLTGDEFAVLVVGVPPWEQAAFGARILDAVKAVDAPAAVTITASVGVSAVEGPDDTAGGLLRRAEAAQAWAKFHGKARVVTYDDRIVRALGVEERLRTAEEESHVGMARALSAAADARDPQNYYHSRNVAALSVLLAEALELEPERVRAVEMAAMLHDVGKIALPDAVLRSGRLSPGQVAAGREHAALGGTLCEALGTEGVPRWVRAHHERWDGAGYPDGSQGADTPLEARIIALADAYDGMTTGKQTGSAMSKAAALQEIDHGLGSRFDPRLAELFISVVGATSTLGWSDEWPGA